MSAITAETGMPAGGAQYPSLRGQPVFITGGGSGIGACLVQAINGSYTNVVGLPLCEVVDVLEHLGAVKLFSSPV